MSLVQVVILAVTLALLLSVIALNFATAERRLERPPPRWYGTHEVDFRRSVGVLLGPPIIGGNQIDTLVNGVQIFPAMLDAIAQARRTICFETFIYWSGDVGAALAKAFGEAAQRGVAVHVLLDWVGSRRMDPALIERMERCGVEVRRYHPPTWLHLTRLNNRTHRKLLIVDGELGFTGGVGIAPQWTGNAEDPDHWRDNHYRVRGPVVAQMQAVFLDNWIKATGEVLHGEAYFPALAPAGRMDAQLFGSSPSGGSESLHLLTLLSITSATRSIDIANAYFVPDDLTLDALIEASRRGVRIRVLVPGRYIDVPIVRRASQAVWARMMDAGIDIHEYLPTMLHNKLMVVDAYVVTVGSANFDNRSFRLNDESILNVFDHEFARQQTEVFEADLSSARRYVRRRWRARSAARRLVEWSASRFRSQL